MSSCLGVLLELQIPELLAKEDKPMSLKDVSKSLPFICTSDICYSLQKYLAACN